MLLCEQVRIVADEEILVNDASNYDAPSGSLHDWTTRATKNVILGSQKIVYVKFAASQVGSNANCAGRCTLDGIPIVASGTVTYGSATTREAFLLLAAGSYTFAFQSANWKAPNGNESVRISGIYIAALNFSDKSGLSYDSGNVSCPLGSTTTVLSQQFTVGSSRKLPLGSIKKYTALITVHMLNTNERSNIPKNAGESDTTSRVNWKIYLGTTQYSWTNRKEDYNASTDNQSYGIGAYGSLSVALDADTQYTLRIDVYNAIATPRTCRCYVRILICPWIIPASEHQPVDLDFPQGSTIYVVTEPLNSDPTKTSKIGKQRFMSFGDSTDYYSTASGTGILSHNYTFESVQVSNCILLIGGNGGCISILAVDIR